MDNNSFSNSSQENPIIEAQGINPNSPQPNSKQNPHRSLIYVIFVVIILGAVAGLMGTYLTNKPEEPEECLECQDPKPTSTSSEVDYAFLQLESSSDNIIYSPLSIRNGLELLSAGADGDTKTEIDKVLGSAALSKYENIPDKLSLANAVFIRESFKDYVLPTYITEVEDELGSEVIYDPFENSTNMDNWVNQKTFGLIDKVGIQPNQDLEMVLANALAIQMDWKYQFDESDTHGRDFFKNDGSTINATTMHKETSAEDILYAVDDSATVVSMPLDSGSEEVNLEFMAIMPSDDLSDYIDNIDQTKIDKLTKSLTPANEPEDGVVINIPKFKFEYKINYWYHHCQTADCSAECTASNTHARNKKPA